MQVCEIYLYIDMYTHLCCGVSASVLWMCGKECSTCTQGLGAPFAVLQHRKTHCRLTQHCGQLAQEYSGKGYFGQQTVAASTSIVFNVNMLANAPLRYHEY